MATTLPVDIDRQRVADIVARERTLFLERNPRSRELAAEAEPHLISGVPMQWMEKWYGAHPVFFDRARGARIWDADGHALIDFCLGDTGSMAGHSPGPTVAAVERRLREQGGSTTMLPSEDAAAASAELAHRFGLPRWTFTLTATDANRFVLRTCRQLTGRPKVLVMSHCYHGSVDETVIELEDGAPRMKPGSVGPQVDPVLTTRVVEFNDLEALERELAHGDVACVLAEPALTNIGIVLPQAGYWQAVRALTRTAGALLVIDETHTISAGPGGCTAAWGLEPDIVTIGKSIGGGIPVGAYGVSEDIARRITEDPIGDYIDVGGVGGTLAGNALSTAAVRATLEEVLTEEAFVRMCALGERLLAGMRRTIERYRAPWVAIGLGARAELRFCPEEPTNGGASAAAQDDQLDEWLHLVTMNRDILITPFHNMLLVCPETTEADIDRFLAVFDEAVKEVMG